MDSGTKASFQRAGTHENAPFHYIHSYAVKDRLDLSQFSDEPPPLRSSKLNQFYQLRVNLCPSKKILQSCFQGEGQGYI